MDKANKKEIRNLLEIGTFKVVLKEDVPKNANVLPGIFVLSTKFKSDVHTKYMGRYIIGVHRELYVQFMVHSATTLQPK